MANGIADDILGGLEAGIGIAQKIEQVQQQRAEFEEKKRAHNAQKHDMIFQGIQRVTAMPQGQMRKLQTKRFMSQARTLNIAMDPAMETLLNDETYQSSIVQGLADLYGLDSEARTEAMQNLVPMLGNAPEMAKFVSDAADKRVQTAKHAAGGAITPDKRLDMFFKARDQFNQDHKTDSEIIKNAANIFDLASTNEGRNKPLIAHAAQVLLNKLLDPTSVVRESEVKALETVNPGITQKAAIYAQRLLDNQKLNPEQWRELLSIVHAVSAGARGRIEASREQVEPELAGAGIDINRVYNIPSLTPFDFKRAFGKPRIGKGTIPETQNTARAQNAAAQTVFNKYSPQMQQRLRTQYGVNPDSPEFASQIMNAITKIRTEQEKRAQALQTPQETQAPQTTQETTRE